MISSEISLNLQIHNLIIKCKIPVASVTMNLLFSKYAIAIIAQWICAQIVALIVLSVLQAIAYIVQMITGNGMNHC